MVREVSQFVADNDSTKCFDTLQKAQAHESKIHCAAKLQEIFETRFGCHTEVGEISSKDWFDLVETIALVKSTDELFQFDF
jgi:uncharacterized protein (DUF1697 family)